MMGKTKEKPSSEEIFDYLKMFNHVVVLDEELASRLPESEFELSFNRGGDIFVNGESLGVNVKQRYEALAPR
jgi:hypothetical protein